MSRQPSAAKVAILWGFGHQHSLSTAARAWYSYHPCQTKHFKTPLLAALLFIRVWASGKGGGKGPSTMGRASPTWEIGRAHV